MLYFELLLLSERLFELIESKPHKNVTLHVMNWKYLSVLLVTSNISGPLTYSTYSEISLVNLSFPHEFCNFILLYSFHPIYMVVAIAFISDGREDNYVYVSEALMAGMVAGAVESIISSPLELMKLRAQVSSASRVQGSASIVKNTAVAPAFRRLLHGYTPDLKALNHSAGLLSILSNKHPNLNGALQGYPWMMTGSGRPPSVWNVRRPSDIVSLEGWSAWWRGLRAGVVRDSVFGGIFFSSWQFLHRAMLDWKAVGMDPSPRYKIYLFNSLLKEISIAEYSLLCFVSYFVEMVLSYIFSCFFSFNKD